MEETLFPRGKGVREPSSGPQNKKSHKYSNDASDLLFSEGSRISTDEKEGKKSAGRKRKLNKGGELGAHDVASVKEALEAEGEATVDYFNIRKAQEGMLVLGCIREIYEIELVVSLPHCATGYVQANQVSEVYTEQIRQHLEEDSTDELLSLSQLFGVGDIVVCSILSHDRKIQLSLYPSIINKYLSKSDFFLGQMISCAVKSEEEHGYTMDVGKAGVKAFLPVNEIGDRKLSRGAVVRCTVTGVRGEGGILILSLDDKKILKSSLKEGQKLSLDVLQPGMIGAFKLAKKEKNGLVGKFMDFKASMCEINCSMDDLEFDKSNIAGSGKKRKKSKWNKNNSEKDEDIAGKEMKGKSLRSCILYINTLTKQISLSASPYVLNHLDRSKILRENLTTFPYGHKCGVTISKSLHGLGVVLKLENGAKGFCLNKHLSDKKFNDVFEVLGKKTSFQGRVMQSVSVDGLVVFNLKRSIVDSEFYSYDNVTPGMKIDCVIQSVQEAGLVVTLGKNSSSPMRGFVSNIHLSDVVLQHPEKIFTKGDSITCRVLSIDRVAGRIKVTHKKTLIKSKLPVVTSYEQLEPDLIVHGYIASIKSFGVFVNFYNNVHGLVPNSQLSLETVDDPEKTFFIGQVMKCRVLSVDQATERARFSFILKPGAKLEQSDVSTPKIVSVEIVSKTDDGFKVIVCDDAKPKKFWNRGILPMMHLSDFPSLAKLYWDVYEPGKIIANCMVVKKSKDWTISHKKSMLTEDGSDKKLTFSDLHLGLVCRGFIHHIEGYGVFVQLYGGLVGLCPKAKMANKFLLTSEGYYHEGQSVVAKVVEIDEDRKRFIVTLREDECSTGDQHTAMEAYINDLNMIMSDLNSEWSENFATGKKVTVEISGSEISPEEYPCSHSGFPNCFSASVVNATSLQKGKELEAVFLYVDASQKKIVLSANSNMKSVGKIGSATQGQVLFLNEDIMTVGGQWKKKIFSTLALSRSHPNKPFFKNNMPYQIGDNADVIVGKDVFGNKFALTKEDSRENKSSRHRQDSESSDVFVQGETNFGNLKVGQQVEGAIRSVRSNGLLVRFTESEMEGGYRGNPVTGHLHISELEDNPQQGPVCLKKYQCWSNIKCTVIGFRDVKTHHFLAITKRNSTRCILELSLRKEPVKLVHQNLSLGQELMAFSVKYLPQKDEVNFEITPNLKGFVPMLLLSNDPVKSFADMHKFKKPVAWRCVVHKILHNSVVLAGKGAMINKETGEDISEIKPGCVTNGKIQKIFASNMILCLPDGGTGRVHITNSADEYLEDGFQKFEVGDMVRCAVIACPSKKSLVLSLRNSNVLPEDSSAEIKDMQISETKNLKPGMIIRGFVKSISQSGVFIALSPTLTGRSSLKKTSKYYIHDTTTVESLFQEGRLVTCKVLNVSQMERKVDLSLLEIDTGCTDLIPEKLGLPLRHGKPHEEKKTKIGLLVDKVEGRKLKKRKLARKIKDIDHEETVKKKKKNVNVDDDQDSGLEDASFGDSLPGYLKILTQDDENKEGDPGFSWDGKEEGKDDSNQDDSSDDSEEEEVVEEVKKKSKKETDADKAKEEAELRRKEELLLKDKMPQTALEWDKLVLASPQNSLLWVSYMAFHLKSTEVDKARAVAERAIKTIDFREEKEKWNVWAGLLNLENRFGTEESLADTIERACKQNDPLKVNFHMVSTFERAEKFDSAEELCQKMARKFKQNKTVWMLYITHLMQCGKRDEANEVFKRSLQSLERKFHLEVISKYGQLEYKTGDSEHGRVLFENALSSYPKRADLWSVYLDMLIKSHKTDEAREVFDRVVTLNLSTKTMRNFFKKYIDFEVKFGNDDKVAEVKRKALEYIESKLNDDED